MTTTGYSGKKERWRLVGAPQAFEDALAPLPEDATLVRAAAGRAPVDGTLWFVKERATLERGIERVQRPVAQGGALWIAWPKKTSGVATDVTEDVLREVVLPTGWVDTKVCAIDETWSGLKFLRRVNPSDKPGRPTAAEVAKRRAPARR